MAEQHRHRPHPVAVHHREIGVANAGGLDADQHLTALRTVELEIDDADRPGFGIRPWRTDPLQYRAPNVKHAGIQPWLRCRGSRRPPPAPDKLTSNDFPVLWPLGTRWADNDMFGHLNNAVYYQLFDTAINAWINTSTGLDPITTPALGIVAESGCRYFSELAFPRGPRSRTRRHSAGTQQCHLPARCVPGPTADQATMRPSRSPRSGTGCTSTSTGTPASRSRFPTSSARCWRRPAYRSRPISQRERGCRAPAMLRPCLF